MFTELDSAAGDGDPVATAAAQAVALVAAEQYFELMARWVQAQPGEPGEWRVAAQFGDTGQPLPARLRRTGLDRLPVTSLAAAGTGV